MNLFRASGFDVHDDNDPAPENIPDTINGDPTLINGQEWRKDGLCRRRMANTRQLLPTIGICGTLDMKIMSLFSLFKLFFPLDWLESVLLSNINKNIIGEEVTGCAPRFFKQVEL
jgi:hypothetical protein